MVTIWTQREWTSNYLRLNCNLVATLSHHKQSTQRSCIVCIKCLWWCLMRPYNTRKYAVRDHNLMSKSTRNTVVILMLNNFNENWIWNGIWSFQTLSCNQIWQCSQRSQRSCVFSYSLAIVIRTSITVTRPLHNFISISKIWSLAQSKYLKAYLGNKFLLWKNTILL